MMITDMRKVLLLSARWFAARRSRNVASAFVIEFSSPLCPPGPSSALTAPVGARHEKHDCERDDKRNDDRPIMAQTESDADDDQCSDERVRVLTDEELPPEGAE